jgi:hypothetical protein
MPTVELLVDDALNRIADLTGGTASSDSTGSPLGQRVALALGWQQEPARLESLEVKNPELKLARGFLGPHRATVFAANGTDATDRFLSDVALFAYHSSINWGLVADNQGATVFNSHWMRGDEWFRLPKILWSQLDQHYDVVASLTPKGISSGSLDQLATRTHPPDRFLLPVDDALVTRLDHWRFEALRFGRTSENLDEDLHTLFAQLFVLRAVEDRRLAANIPTLQSTVEGQQVNNERLLQLFGRARNVIQTDLFADNPLNRFPDFVLAGIIRDLYTPSNLPPDSQRYNFAWIDADILGRAYEKYLATVFAPAPLSPQLRLFDQPQRELEPISVKKSGGVFYTPEYLVRTLT